MSEEPMSDSEREERRNFHLQEFEQLHAEFMATVARTESLFKYAVVISAAVFSWLTKEALDKSPTGVSELEEFLRLLLVAFAFWLPTAFTWVLGMAAQAYGSRIKDFDEYFEKLENEFRTSRLGWVNHLGSTGREDIAKQHKSGWYTLVGLNITGGAIASAIMVFRMYLSLS